MRVTTKGQVTIPQQIREKMGITPATEIIFLEEKGRVYIAKKPGKKKQGHILENSGVWQVSK